MKKRMVAAAALALAPGAGAVSAHEPGSRRMGAGDDPDDDRRAGRHDNRRLPVGGGLQEHGPRLRDEHAPMGRGAPLGLHPGTGAMSIP